ncbi:MAG: extracellular solute-binding protein [Saccharofermentanales bacterium]
MKRKAVSVLLIILLLIASVGCKPDTVDESKLSSDSNAITGSGSGEVSEDFWSTDESAAESESANSGNSDPSSSNGSAASSSNTSNAASVVISQPEITGFVFPKLSLANKTLKIMTVDKTTTNVDLVNKLKSQYDLTIQDVMVEWAELPLKLSAAVLAGSSPDAVIYRSDNPDMPSFVIKNLVQPIENYTDLNNKIYDNHDSFYKVMAWGSKHYVLVSGYSRGPVLMYNTKLFKDYGVEDPWKLYTQGKWNWTKFAELSVMFKDDTNKDGEQDRYGFVLGIPPSNMIYTTGESFGSFDGANKQISNNMKSVNIARCMDFMHELLFVKNGGNASMPTADPIFKNGIAAMTFASADAPYLSSKTFEYLNSKGQLGVVPLPKDPKASKQFYYCRVGGYFIPKGAKNPLAAVALNATILYLNQDKEGRKAIRDKALAKGYSQEFLDKCEENWNSGTPVLELTPFLGYDSIWLSFQNKVPWATQVAQDEAKVQVQLDDIFETEIELPTGPKVVENFEKLGSSTTASIVKYIPGIGGSTNIAVYLDNKSPYQGTYNGRIDYTISGTFEYAYISKSLNSTWNTNNTLTFWAKGDGKADQRMTVQLKSGNGAPFNKEIILTGTGKVYSIPFSEFVQAEWWPNKGDILDINNMTEIGFMFIDMGEKRSAYIDMVEAVKK